MSIIEMQAKRDAAAKKLRELHETIGVRAITEDEQHTWDATKAEIKDWDARIARQVEIDAEDDRVRAAALTAQPPVAGGAGAARITDVRDLAAERPFANLGEQLLAVRASTGHGVKIDPRLLNVRAASGASEGIDADGGYLVQTDFSTQLYEKVYAQAVIASRCDRTPISSASNGLEYNAIDETSRATGSRYGGVQIYRAAEAGTVTAKKPKYRQVKMKLQKLMGLYYATDELLQDATALESIVTKAFSTEFAWVIDNEALNGTGAGQMLGINNSPAVVSVAKETGQAAQTIVAQNIMKMFARMWAPSWTNAYWYVNQDTMPQLMQLSLAIGTGGVPLYLPPGGLSAAPYGALLGRPVQPIEQCETLGTVGDIVLADFSEYHIIEKGGLQTASSMHVSFLTDEMAFRFTLRNDGQPKWNAPLTPAKGSNTLSPFVTLATRA